MSNKKHKIIKNKTEVIALCSKCDRASTKFFALDEDLTGDRFVASPKSYYGVCACGSSWVCGTVLRNVGSPEARVVLLERENKALREQEKTLKTRLEAYEYAMMMMSGRRPCGLLSGV